MHLRNRLGAVGASLISLGVLAGATAAPVRAATQVSAAGSILCNADLCPQTVSINTSNQAAQVNVWADTKALNPGFFTLLVPAGSSGIGEGFYSPTRTWPAGDTHYTFTVPLRHGTYIMTAHAGQPPGHEVGEKDFGINF